MWLLKHGTCHPEPRGGCPHPPGGAKLHRSVFCSRHRFWTHQQPLASFARPPGWGHLGLRGSWWPPAPKAIIEWCLSPYSSWIYPPGIRSSFATWPTCSVPAGQIPFEPSSPPGSFWPDVFVTSRLPWSRFGFSVIGHVAAIAAIIASAQFWPQAPAVVVRQAFNRNDVIYYAPSEYLPPSIPAAPGSLCHRRATRLMRHSLLFRYRPKRIIAARLSSRLPISS